jgi:hypothetical protein
MSKVKDCDAEGERYYCPRRRIVMPKVAVVLSISKMIKINPGAQYHKAIRSALV